MAEDIVIGVDVNADPAYKKLTDLRNEISKVRSQMMQDLKVPSKGGLDAKTFKATYGTIKAEHGSFLKELDRLDQRYANKQQNMFASSLVNVSLKASKEEAKQLAIAQAQATASSGGLINSLRGIATESALGDANIVRLRYALYDVGFAAQQTAQAFAVFAQSTITAAMDYETAFTAVERATQLDINTESGRAQIMQLRSELLALSEELPNTFQDISGVAALGSALGIANEDLTKFTETVIQFSAASNVGIEASAQAFGTLGELLNVTAENYDRVGSAIAFVGVNSNATESQVISVAEAIAGVASASGLSADFTIGLAGALASLKVPAEQSRGALTRVFAEINRATAAGGPALQNFASVLGMTTDQVRELAASDMGAVFTQLVQSLSGMSAEDITYTLDALNLADIRVTNTLVRLAENFDTTTDSLRMASDAYADGTYLAEAYGVKADDIAVRLQKLVNTVQNLLAGFGESLFPIIGPVIDFLQTLANNFEQLLNNPIGKWAAGVASAFALIGAAFFGLIAAIIPIGGGLLAFRTTMQELEGTNSRLLQSLARVAGGLTGVGGSADKAKMSFLGLAGSTANSARMLDMIAAGGARASAAFAVMDAQQKLTLASGNGLNAQIAARIGLLKANTQAVWANVAAMTAMQRVMAAAGWIGIAISAISLLSAAWDAFNQEQQTAFEKNTKAAEDYFGTAVGLADAMRQDMEAGASTIKVQFDEESVARINNAATAAKSLGETQEEANARAVQAIDEATGATERFTTAQGGAETAVQQLADEVQVAYGDAAKTALAELLKQSQDFKDIISSGAIEQLGGTGAGLVAAILGDPQEGARNYINSLLATIDVELGGKQIPLDKLVSTDALQNQMTQNLAIESLAKSFGISKQAATELISEIINLDTAQQALTGQLQGSSAELATNQAITEGLSGALGNATSEALKAEKALGEYVGNLKSIQAGNDALDELSQSIAENGTAFAESLGASASYTQGAVNNSIVLGETIKSVIEAASAAGLSTAQASAAGVAQVFAQMVANGVEATNALNAISAAGFGGFTGGLKVAMSGQYAGLTNAFNAIRTSANKAGGAVGGVSAKVRTLIDYANDLKNVWQRAFDIRFSGQQALDKIYESWQNIRDAIQDARDEIKSLNADVQRLTADKALQQYFLSVAEAFGDSVKAAEIRANLAEIDAELVDVNKKLATAQAKTNKTLTGNSKQAIENRAEILELVSGYQDYIYALASSGASQGTLSAATQQMRNDFISQATALGYSRGEVEQYAVAFDDVSTAISRVPRNITVAANTNPALQALNELNARANSATAPRTLSVGASVDYSALQKFARGASILNSLTAAQAAQQEYLRRGNTTAARVMGITVQQLSNVLNSGNFAAGGYVSGPGSSTSDSIPANLSDGEYVIRAAAVNKYGVDFFNQLNQMRMPQYYSGGQATSAPSVQMVALSPEDRALLRNAGGSGEVVLYANNEAIARSANAGNRNIVAQGGRP